VAATGPFKSSGYDCSARFLRAARRRPAQLPEDSSELESYGEPAGRHITVYATRDTPSWSSTANARHLDGGNGIALVQLDALERRLRRAPPAGL